jgi:hypothetical protein
VVDAMASVISLHDDGLVFEPEAMTRLPEKRADSLPDQ